MKSILAATLLALLAAPGAALAQGAPAATQIVVSGTGNITLPPDIATVSSTVQTNSANAADAVSRNNAIYERVAAALTKLGIARADVSLAAYNVSYNPKPKNEKLDADTIYGYTVSRDFSVKVRDIAKAGSVVDACTHAGATSIGGVSFDVDDQRGAQSQATAKAVDDARAKAEALASAAHLRVTGIKSIHLGADGGPPMPMMKMAMSTPSAGVPTQFDSSNVSVSVTVQMTFLAQP